MSKAEFAAIYEKDNDKKKQQSSSAKKDPLRRAKRVNKAGMVRSNSFPHTNDHFLGWNRWSWKR